jgi:hypothetical protein
MHMTATSSDQGDIVGLYSGQMLRQMLMGGFGIGGLGQIPLPAGTVELSKYGVKATQHGWAAWLFDTPPWTCRYREIQKVEAIRVGAGFNLLYRRSGSSSGVRIDRGTWMTRLIFLTDSASEVLDICERMGAPVARAAKRLPPLLLGRK